MGDRVWQGRSSILLSSSDGLRINAGSLLGLTRGSILAVTPLLSLWMLDIQSIYPGHLIWVRSVIRLALAALLYYLRPRERQWKTAGNF